MKSIETSSAADRSSCEATHGFTHGAIRHFVTPGQPIADTAGTLACRFARDSDFSRQLREGAL